jgi:hypothetical protein
MPPSRAHVLKADREAAPASPHAICVIPPMRQRPTRFKDFWRD